MLGLALGMFIALFAFGHELLGWTDTGGQVAKFNKRFQGLGLKK